MDAATASDNCGEVTIEEVSETIAGDCAGNYTITRTFTATDDAGNSTSATQTITVQDTTAPEFTSVPADYTAECSDELILDDASASDNCGTVSIEVSSETIDGDAAGNYTVVRTFTAMDDCGNSTSATQTITVQDTTAPEFTSVPADYTAECSDELIMDAASASDNCGEVTIEEVSETIAGDCAGNYTITRTFTATDDAGNSTSATQTITVQDTTAPEFTSVPADYTAECSDALILDDASASDNCGTVNIEVSSETIDGDAAGNYTVVRTFTATDDCGNSTSATQTITVQDTTAPELTIPADYTAECSDELVMDAATASDNCGEVTIEEVSETIAGDCAGNYTITRTFTASDDAGNSTSATQTITVQDTTAPELSIPADYTAECSDELILDDAMASDNCGTVSIEVSSETIDGDAAGNYTVVRTFTATDDCGNSTSATQTITVQDTTAPELTIPADYTAECSDELVMDAATASDNCGEVAIEEVSETIEGDCVGNYTITRTFTATDDAGNSTSATQTITVQDTTAPELTIPADYTAECSDELILEEATATDNCTTCNDSFDFTSTVEGYGLSLELVASHEEGDLAGMRTYRIYLDVASSDDQVTSFTGNDEFALSLNTTTSFYQNPLGGSTPNDISDAAIALVPELAYDSYVTVGLTGQPEGAEGSVELIPGSWMDAFEAGGSFTVNDGIGSGWYIVPPVAVNGLGGDDQRVLVAQLTTDGDLSGQFRTQVFPQGDQTNDVRADMTFAHSHDCGDLTLEVSSETIAGDCAGNYTIERTFTATDACGNSTSATQSITVQDTTAPELTIPADYTAECSDELVLDAATASDNCGEVTIEQVSETTAGDCAGNYMITRTFTATDDCGNSTSATQTITVEDTTAPEFTSVPADYTAECSDALILDDATASDNCGSVSIEVSSETIDGDAAGNYTVVRTFTATDDCGNSTSATQTITVQDTTAPELTIPADYTAECSDELVLDAATASDNCGEVTIEQVSETTSGDCAGNYTITRTFTATDDAGNSTSATQTITVEDTTAPEFTSVPADYTAECSDALILDDASASDNCGTVSIEVSSETIDGDAAGNYTVVRTFTATDDCGNSTSATQTITVQDTTAPEFTSVPADYTAECSDELVMDAASASDNCGEVTIEEVSETIAGDCAGNYTITRTFTATDDAGNSMSATQTITVQDTTAPEFTSVPADYTAECSDALILDDATASDNCGTVSIEVSSETIDGDAAGNYTVVRTFTATDDCGNSTSATQTITVEDTTAPELTIPADYTAECSDELVMDAATASDNCGEVTIEEVSETIAGDCAGNYTITRTFTATDDAGNSTSATQTITVQDTTAPEFTSVPADYTAECSDELILDDASASDNCGTVSIEVSSETIDGDAAGNYTVVRTFTATDDCGNSTSATQTITVQDTTAPELTIPADYTAECSDELVMDAATASDNCGEVTIEEVSETIAGDCAGNYTITRTFTATDDAGNSTSATQTITVQDTTAPEFTSVPADYTAECSDELILDDASASDNCGTVSIEVSSETIDGDAAGNYTVVRTFTATDDCGNSTSATQTITVQDTTAPELTIPADYTAECSDELVMDAATASDNCGEVTIEEVSETIAGDCAGNYTITRTFTATDDAGNSMSATQTITVQDTTAPELSIPADYTAECSDELILDDATATDNCTSCNDNFDFTSTAEGYGLSLELVDDHEEGVLAGMSTYRVYLEVANANDQVTSFTGNDEFALALNTTTSFYQNALGGATPNDISDAAIALVPELAYDSYVTVGLTGEPEGAEGNVELIPGDWVDAFEAGDSFTVNDGIGSGWYIVPPVAVNGLGGDDQRVLVAQLTTDGDLSGQFRTQVFPEGDQINDVRADLTFTHSRSCEGLTIEVSSEEIAGDCAGSYTIERTFTATDACGNSSSATQTITVQDTTAPEFTSVPADYTAECSDALILDDASASDNCGTVSIEVSSETIDGDAAGNYTVVRTFTATDDCGNSTSATQTITVQDTTAPELTIPADYTAECSDELVMDAATASDNCGEVTIEEVSETIAGDCAGNYTITRTFTATDDAGNSTSATQTITVEDTTAPEFTSVPADYTAECSDELMLDDASASDNCGTVSIEVSSETIDGDAAGNYTVVRTFTATDDCGNSTSATQTITVQDTTAPEFTSVPADYTAECSDELIMDAASASDNCGEVTIEEVSETIAGDCAGNYTITRTFTATDDAGNSTSATQTITVEDTTAPEFTSVPADYTAECSDALILDDASASDNCGTVSIEVSSETIDGDAAGNYTVVRTFTATDDCGNSTSATQTITVQDTTAPEFTSVPADYTAECSDELVMDAASASDNCGEVTIEEVSETIAGDCAGNYTITRTFTATDDAGNSTSATQTITVQDTTAPEFTSVPADYTAECSDALILDDATASDNCGTVSIEVSSETIDGDAAGNYTVVRTFTATDDCGNSTSATQTITVEDTTAPELTIPADYTAECSDELVMDAATASDNCGEVTIEEVSETIAGDCAGNYTITRTFTATDDAGNSTSATQTITVEDTTAPEFTSVPADYTAECSDALILDDASASDNCGTVSIEVSSETIDGDAAGNYTVVRTFTATDDCGNSTSATQTITVQDTTAPEFTSVPADYTAECSDELIMDAASASDNCGEVTIEEASETIAGDCAGNYTITRTFTATDDAGNSTSATQTITVQDTTAPEFTSVPADYTAECSDALILDDATASDNCGTVSIEVSSETIDGDAAGNYTVVRTFTATDDCGNSTSATQTITVEDTTAPELTIPADYTAECSDELVMDAATASDNCGEVTIEEVSETIAGDCAGNYTITRTFTASDDAGNSTSATQTITVEDTTAPEFTSVPADYTAECSDALILDDASASDNCGTVSIEVSSETIDGDAAGNYTVVRTFTAMDDCGNSTSATQTITVQDTTAPEFTSVPADYTAECSDELIMDAASASDNCGEVTIEEASETIAGDCAGNYTITRTFTATDDAGNSTSATQTITVQDTTAPEFTSVPADYTAECSDELILDDASASDNCGTVSIEVSSETIDGDAAGNYTVVRTFTATDDCGNSTSATQTITLQDTTAPELTIPEDYTAECSDDLVMDAAIASDNCGDVTIEEVSETIAGDCAGNYTITRTFTASDDAGNSTSATQTITVQDTTAPELNIPADYTAECSDALILDDATASDNCGTVSIEVSSETIDGDAAGNYTVVRTFTATDDCGNSTSATQTITVQDTTAPELTIPADYTAECSDELVMDAATASDNCGEVTIEEVSETIAGDCAGNYTITRTFTATDDAGNSTSATQTITVEDTTAPEFTSVPADYTAECSDALILDDASASDNCGTVSIEVSSETIDGDAAGNYTVVRTFTATDDCGNSTSATQTITVQDTTAPEFTSVPADYTAECSDELVMDAASASDNCGEVTIEEVSETIAGDCAGNYTITRTFTATDDAGNSTSATQTITVQDTTAPEFTSVPADYTAECSDALILDDATASDNCGTVSIEVSSETIDGDAAGNYTVVRTFTATDDCGNSTSATQTITVQDTTAPELTIPADYTAECSDELVMDAATASDNCGEVTIEEVSETIAGDCAGNYTITRTFTATDDAGNNTSATQTITVQDTTAPELSIPADYTAECTDDLTLDDATATDNCSAVTIDVTSETLAGECANAYLIVRTFTATDACGNSTTSTQTISVVDTTGPELFLPPSYEADCGDELLLLDALASDACGLALVTVEESYDYTCENGYVLTRTFTAVDACFNETVGVQTITVTDTTAPEFTSIPADFSAECSDEIVLDMATASDDCSEVTVTVSADTLYGECANTYTVVRTFTAMDACGNSTDATQTIQISDTTAPEFTFVPADELIECNTSLDGTMATAVDNCGDVTVTVEENFDQGDCGGAYVITRTFTATDACGNASTAVQTITQEDTTAPSLVIPADVTIECDEEVPAAGYTAEDACGAVSVEVTEEIVAGDCPQEMTILRTYVATDDCGNSASAVQTITVQDTTAPVFTFTPDATSTVYAAEGDTLVAPFVVVLDNCDTEASWSVEETILVDEANELTVERVYTAFDACGNTSTYTEVTTLVLQVLGCTDPTACNYNEFANEDDNSCFFPLYGYDCDGNCINDVNENGICDELEIAGCTDPDNPGYNPEANVEDGSCLTGGCTIAFACNYDPTAEFQIAGSCEFTSCAGCTSADACNYDEDATLNDGSCEFPDYGYDCDGNCINDADGDGICDEFEIAGCTDPSNPAYNPAATDDDGSCLVAGCLLPFACNFDPTADYLDVALCDLNSCAGCTDPTACTYDPSATLSAPAACTYPVNQFVDCDGNCINDADGDGVCDELEIPGCTNPEASNYSPFATDDNGTCIIEVGGCTLPFACNYDPSADFYLPGSCDFSCLFGMPPGEGECTDELACNYGMEEPCAYFDAEGNLCATVGCMNEEACNFNPEAQVNSGCEYASCQTFGCTNSNACNYDAEANTDNGSCEYSSCLGCTDNGASNFDPEASIDNGQCTYDVFGCTLLIACNYDPVATVNDGSCDFTGCFGCVTPTACNYDDNALYPDGSCLFAAAGQDCDGNCLSDQDGDMVCDANEVPGCMDESALNYNPNATDDNGTCTYLMGGCTDQTACNFDYTAQVDNGTCDFGSCAGCIVSWACNYDATATLNDGSCVFPDINGVCPSVCDFDVDGDGICDANEVAGCTYANAINYEPLATDDDGSCNFVGCVLPDYSSYNELANTNSGDCTNAPGSADFTGDGLVQLEDLLEFLVAYGTSGPEWGLDWVQDGCSVVAMGIAEMDVSTSGCTYPTASNYDASAAFDTGSCVWLGCTDEEAYNFNHLATMDDSSCTYNICPDFNGDGQVQTQDLLDFLIAWGAVYE